MVEHLKVLYEQRPYTPLLITFPIFFILTMSLVKTSSISTKHGLVIAF